MNNERQIAKQKFDEHFMFKDNPIAWTAWKMAFQLGIEHQRLLQQTDCKAHVCHHCGGLNGHTIECTAWAGKTVTV